MRRRAPIRVVHFPHLRPRRLHERLLILLDHASAEAGDDALRGVRVQLLKPIRVASLHLPFTALELRVNPGTDTRQFFLGECRIAGHGGGTIQRVTQFAALRERPLFIRRRIGGRLLGGKKSALQHLHPAGFFGRQFLDAAAREMSIDDAPSDLPRRRDGLDFSCETLEVAMATDGETPLIVVGQEDLLVIVTGGPFPGVSERATGQAEPGLHAAIIGWHEAGDVADVLPTFDDQTARTEDAREIHRPILHAQTIGNLRRRAGLADNLRMGKSPRFGERLQLAFAGTDAAGQPRRRSLEPGVARFEHDEDQPGIEPAVVRAVRRCWRKEPRQLRPVEFDVRQKRFLGVGRTRPGIAPDDLRRFQTEDVARPAQSQLLRNDLDSSLVVPHRHADLGNGAQFIRRGILHRRSEPAAHPRQESVCAELDIFLRVGYRRPDA